MPRQIIKQSPATLVRRKKRTKRIIILCLLFAVIIFGLSYVSKMPAINISSVVVDGAVAVSHVQVEEIANKEISGRYMSLFSKKNIFIYPGGKVRQKLLENFKRIDTLNLIIENNSELHIKITERGGKYLWCGEHVPDPDTSPDLARCYFVDDAGYIFSQAPYFSDNIYFKFYGVRVEEESEVSGSHVADAELFAKLTEFATSIKSLGLTPRGMLLGVDGENNLLLERRGNNDVLPPRIMFKSNADLEKVTSVLSSALAGEPLKEMMEEKYSKLLYLDLRFANKVFYKFSE